MVKFLRKYRKYLLVVGGSILMVTFLVPQAFNSLMGDPGKAAFAYIGDEKITRRDHDFFDREFHAVDKFNEALTRRVLGCENTVHWMLLTREAEQGGFVAEAGDGSSWTALYSQMEVMLVRQIATAELGDTAQQKLAADPELVKQYQELAARRVVEAQRKETAASHQLTDAEFNIALAKLRGAYRMIVEFQSAPFRVSDRRAVALKRDRFEGMLCETLRVPADRIAFAMPDPTPEEIQAQFDKYRDVAPETGEMGFGYRLQPRAKLEWLAIDRAVIENAVAGDAVEANKRWRNNRPKYPGEFVAEQPRIEAEIKRERVDKIATDIDVLVRGELKRASGRLEADGLYKKLPADWATQRPKLEDIAQKIVKSVKENSGIDLPLPAVHVEASKWWIANDMYALPGIGQSNISLGAGQNVPFSAAVFFAREFRPPESQGLEIGLQTGLTSGDLVAVDSRGSRFYFTILDHRLESAPDALEEVRDRCIEDLKKLKAFEWLKSQLSAFEGLSVAEGVAAVKKLVDDQYPLPKPAALEPGKPAPDDPRELRVQSREFVPRYVPRSDNPTDSPELRAKLLAIAERLDPTKPATEMPVAERTVAVAIPRALTVQIARLIARQPVTFEMIRATGDQRTTEVIREQIQELAKSDPALNPYLLDALKTRLSFRMDAEAERGDEPTIIKFPKRRDSRR